MKEFPLYRRRVQFADTDLAGIVHFSKILAYIEEAEHFVMQSVSVPAVSALGGFPKVHVDCDYRSPLRFEDEIEIEMNLSKLGGKSLRWNFTLMANGRVSAEGSLVTVFVTHDGQSIAIPLEYTAQLT